MKKYKKEALTRLYRLTLRAATGDNLKMANPTIPDVNCSSWKKRSRSLLTYIKKDPRTIDELRKWASKNNLCSAALVAQLAWLSINHFIDWYDGYWASTKDRERARIKAGVVGHSGSENAVREDCVASDEAMHEDVFA